VSDDRPSILLVHWHDTGRHLGTYGAAGVDSPNVDALAADGIRFDRAFATAPVCSPSRGSLFTGRYPHANGLMGLSNLGWEYGAGERTLPSLLSEAGYRTALIGLQHESWDASTLGYGELHAVGESIVSDFRYCELVADAAESWLDGAGGAPFFASVGFWETHRPWNVERYAPAEPAGLRVPGFLPDNVWTRDDLAAFHGSIAAADAALGRVLRAAPDDAWVIFTTDHGIAFPGAKCTLYEPGIGVALVMRPPRAWGAPLGPTDRLWSHVDLVPTVLEAVGLPLPAGVHGVSHAAWLRGGSAPARTHVFAENTFHDRYDPTRAVRSERFKYIRSAEERPRLVLPMDFAAAAVSWGLGSDHLRHRPSEELYDLAEDPLERRNLAGDAAHEALRAELALLLDRWQAETGDPLLDGPIEAPPVPRLRLLGALEA